MMLALALIVAPQLAFATNAAGLAYLEENKGKDGVVTLPCAPMHAPTATGAPPARLPPSSVLRPPVLPLGAHPSIPPAAVCAGAACSTRS